MYLEIPFQSLQIKKNFLLNILYVQKYNLLNTI